MTTYTLAYAAVSAIFQKVLNDEFSLSLPGAVQTAGRTGNRYRLSMSFTRKRSEYHALIAQISQLHGGRHRLLVPMSKCGYVRQGVGGGTPLMNGAHSAGATSISLKSLPSNTTGILQPGDWIQIGNQLSRVVTILSSSGTTGSCTIFPELHKNYADGASVNYATPGGVFLWMGDSGDQMDHAGIGVIDLDLMQDVLA